MATGGYNASFGDNPTGFGSEATEDNQQNNGKTSYSSSAPLMGLDYKKHEDLQAMLDGGKDSTKLEAMKIIVGMVAKGRDCTNLFPAVVKNVVSKNAEIKKLVYVYLVRYAEEQQDLALLSISTFQKALKDPNQLIRASALRVLSSIRVPIIAPIMMLSIKESVTDMSPYVRKTAAHAIPKLFSLDPELKEQLVEVIEKLLKDQTTLVAGSVVMAYEMVCPDRIDLIHKNYRKLCNLLVDVDEWGQVTILNMLTRYARTQFMDPNQEEEVMNEKFYDDSESENTESEDDDDEEEGKKKSSKKPKKKLYSMDPDHRLLLRVSKPLLQSRNAAVVMAVAQLYHHVGPRNEVGLIARPLIRLLKGPCEVQSIVLSNIATLSAERPNMFEPYLKSFFVNSNDPTHIRLLKLDIMANIAGETSIHTILREFRAYISSSDRQFAAATIQAIGRVACNIAEVTETCLHGLMSLLQHKNEAVVAESVVVIKKLLQLQPKENKDLIIQVAKMAGRVEVAGAKASILWLVGEYCTLVPKIAPDILRKAAKDFINEEDSVKLQIINLSAKLCVSNPRQTKLICQYVFNLAKYDQNYDIRDRARFLRQLVLPADDEATALSKFAKKILMASKPAPVLESHFKSRSCWQLGSLSHFINAEASGYIPLPGHPAEPPDPSVRDVEEDGFFGRPRSGSKRKKESFFEDSEDSNSDEFYSSISGSEESGSEEESTSGSEEGSDESGSEEDSEEDESDDEESSDEDVLDNLRKHYSKGKPEDEEDDDDDEESSEEETSSENETESSEEDVPPPPKPKQKPRASPVTKKQKKAAGQPSLLDLDNWDEPPAAAVAAAASSPAAVPSGGGLLQPLTGFSNGPSLEAAGQPTITPSLPVCVPDGSHDLLNRIAGEGLAAKYRFLRKPHISSNKMVAVEITFQNTLDSPISGITVAGAKLEAGMKMNANVNITQIIAGGSMTASIGIDFNDTLRPAKFNICNGSDRQYSVKIDPVIGELLQAAQVSVAGFSALQDKLTGMHENSCRVATTSPPATIEKAILQAANFSPVKGSQDASCLRFASVTLSGKLPVLLTVRVEDGNATITVNCEKMVFSSMLVQTVKETVSSL